MRDSDPATTIDWNRRLSLLVAMAYLLASGWVGGGEDFFRMAMALLLPMACICFGEAMGSAGVGAGTAFLSGGPAITKPSPAGCIVAVGWLVLLAPAIYLLLIYLRT